MAEKKDLCRFTVQFNASDPCHQQTVDILNQQGRRKAQFIVNAVMHYLHCPETPDIPQPIPADTALIESIVRRILSESLTVPDSHVVPKPERTIRSSKSIQFDQAADLLGEDGMAAIASSLASFRK